MTEDVVLDSMNGDIHPVSVYYNDLLPAIKALDEQPLRFDVGEMQMTVYHEIGSFRLPLNNSCDEFLFWKAPCPDIEAKDCHSITYEVPVLASILNRCSYAMAQDELRPVMNGLHINLTEDYSDYVSSDGHILVRVRKQPIKYRIFGDKTAVSKFIIPARIVNILRRVLPKTGDVDIDYQEKLEEEKTKKQNDGNGNVITKHTIIARKAQCCITIDNNLTIAFNPVDGRYPNYCAVIPDNNPYEMLIDRRALTKSLDRLMLFANDSNKLVRMAIRRDNLKLSTSDDDFELAGEETLPCESNLNSDLMQIGMKTTTLSKTLKTMSTEKVAIHFMDSTRAVIINPQPQPDNEELTYLLMPMIYND